MKYTFNFLGMGLDVLMFMVKFATIVARPVSIPHTLTKGGRTLQIACRSMKGTWSYPLLLQDLGRKHVAYVWKLCLTSQKEKRGEKRKSNTVSILSVGVWLEGKNRFFDTNRKDQNCISLN